MKLTVAAAALVALVATACGNGGDDPSMNMGGSTGSTAAGAAATKTVEITMVDIAYEPKTLSVKQGERIEFVFQNKGAVMHDAFVGDAAAQAEHEKEMVEGKKGADSASDTAITVEPGKTGRLTYTFDKPGTIEIGCHEPGHYTAGMKVLVTVA